MISKVTIYDLWKVGLSFLVLVFWFMFLEIWRLGSPQFSPSRSLQRSILSFPSASREFLYLHLCSFVRLFTSIVFIIIKL